MGRFRGMSVGHALAAGAAAVLKLRDWCGVASTCAAVHRLRRLAVSLCLLLALFLCLAACHKPDQGEQKPAAQRSSTVAETSESGDAVQYTVKPQPDNAAIVIGINYRDSEGIRDLEKAEGDAEAVKNALVEDCGFNPDVVVSLLGPDAIYRRIHNALHGLCDLNTGTVVFFFSGHGQVFNGRDYLIPYDGELDPDYADRNICLDDVYRLLAASGFERQVMLIDACRGNIASTARGSGGEQETGFVEPDWGSIETDGDGHGMGVIFGTKFNELSHEPPELDHGLFTQALLSAMAGKAVDPKGRITYDSLYEAVLTSMKQLSFQVGYSQTPERVIPTGLSGTIVLGEREVTHPPKRDLPSGGSVNDASGVATEVTVDPSVCIQPANSALVVGINDYQSEYAPDLRYAESDAHAVRDALVRDCGLLAHRVSLLTGSEATHLNIRNALQGLKKSGNGTVLFFFSGHALSLDGEDCLVPYDGEFDPRVESRALSLGQIIDDVRDSACGNLVLLLDCDCSSASATHTIGDDRSGHEKRIGIILGSAPGSPGFEVPPQEDGVFTLEHGVFTYALLETLKDSAFGADGTMTFGSLHQALVAEMTTLGSTTGVDQLPAAPTVEGAMSAAPIVLAVRKQAAVLRPYRQELTEFQQQLDECRDTGDLATEGELLHSIGQTHVSLGEPDQALDYFEQALTVSRELADAERESRILADMSSLCDLLGEDEKATAYQEMSAAALPEGGFFLDTHTRYYDESELESFTADQLALAVNEVLARHGRGFAFEKWRRHFQEQSWYEEDPLYPVTSNGAYDDSRAYLELLNDFERANYDLLVRLREERR